MEIGSHKIDLRIPDSHILKKDSYHFAPFPNMESCHVCHGPDSKLRGILAMDIVAKNVHKEQVIQSAIIGFNNLMRLQRASYAGVYIDEIRKLPFVENFQIFGNFSEHAASNLAKFLEYFQSRGNLVYLVKHQ